MHILTPTGATVVIDGKPRMISKSHKDWPIIFPNLDNEDALRRILNPAAAFEIGERWLTRAGGEAVITRIDGTNIIAEVDDCYEVELTAGQVTPGVANDDDLMERIA